MGTNVLWGIWFGGFMASILQVIRETVSMGGVPIEARLEPKRYGIGIGMVLLFWPASLILLIVNAEKQRRQQEADEEEWQRIESTRRGDFGNE